MDLNNNKRGSLKQLQDHKTGFDKEAMWANLQPPKKKRRFPFWWWFGGSPLAIAAFGMIWFFNNQEVIPKTDLVENTTQVAPTPEASSEPTFVEKEIPIAEKTQSEKGQIGASIESKIISPSGNEVAQKSYEIVEVAAATAPPIGKTSFAVATDNSLEVMQSLSTKVETKKVVNNLKSTTYETESKKEEEIIKRDLQDAIAFLPPRSEFETSFDISQLLPLEFNYDAPNLIKRSRGSSSIKIGIYGGYGTHFNSFASKISDVNSDALIFRKENETPLDNFTVGVLIEKNIFKRFSLKTGIELTQLNDKMVYKTDRFGHVNDFDSNEVPSEFRSQSGFLKANDNHTFYNQTSQLNVPLMMSYELPIGRFSIVPEAGVIWNVTNSAKGELLSAPTTAIALDDYYKKNVGMSYRVGLQSGFRLNGWTKVFASPIYTWGDSDWTNAMSTVSHQVAQLRLDLGLVCRF